MGAPGTIVEYGSSAGRGPAGSTGYRVTADGRWALTGDRRLDVVDLVTGAVTGGPRVHCWTVDGVVAVTVPEQRPDVIVLRSVPGLAVLREVEVAGPVDRLLARSGTVLGMVADGTAVVLVRGDAVHRVELPDRLSCAAVAEDGSLVAIGTDRGRGGSVLVVDVQTGALRCTLTGPRAPVRSVALSAAHDLVAAAAGSRVLGWSPGSAPRRPVLLWKPPVRVEHPDVLGISDGGLVIAFGHRTGLVGVDPASGTEVWSSECSDGALVGGRLVERATMQVREFDPESGAERRTWELPFGLGGGYGNNRGVSAGAGAVVLDGLTRPLVLRDGAHSPAVPAAGHSGQVVDAAFDGDRFATRGDDDQILVWRRGRGEPLHVLDAPGAVRDNRGTLRLRENAVYAGVGNAVYRWRLGDPRPQAWSVGLPESVCLVQPLPDRDRLLVGHLHRPWQEGALLLLEPGTLEVRAEQPAAVVPGIARYVPGSGTVELVDGRRRYTVDLDTLQMVAEVLIKAHPSAEKYLPEVFLTPDDALRVELRPRRQSPADLRIVEPTTQRQRFRGSLPPCWRPVMSGQGRIAVLHPGGILILDLVAGVDHLELPLELSAADDTGLWWFPDGSALLVGYGNGSVREVPVPPAG